VATLAAFGMFLGPAPLAPLPSIPSHRGPPQSISKVLSKYHSLNHYLESRLHKKSLSISFYSKTIFLYLVCTLESHARFLYLASEKSKI
jgi:hypothetical protein